MNLEKTLKKLNKNKYRYYKKIHLGGPDKNMFLDYVIISRFGVFVIKIVEHIGTIYGGEKDIEWKVYTKNRGILKFKSPLPGNFDRIKRLYRDISEIDPQNFHSIILFPNKTKLMVDTINAKVINENSLIEYIEEFKDEVLSDLKFSYLIQLFESYKSFSNGSSLSKLFKKKKEVPKTEKCPLCGAKLIYKEGDFGDYYICSNFPTCRYRKEA